MAVLSRAARDIPPVGSLYQEADGRRLTWRVEAIIYPVTNVPHVRLVRADDRTVQRTIAVGVLRDGRRLRLISRGEADGSAPVA